MVVVVVVVVVVMTLSYPSAPGTAYGSAGCYSTNTSTLALSLPAPPSCQGVRESRVLYQWSRSRVAVRQSGFSLYLDGNGVLLDLENV